MKRPSQRGLSVLFERTRNEKLRICRFFIFNEIVGPSFISGLSLPPLRDPPSCPVTLDCGFLATPGFLSRKGPRLQTIHKFASHLESIRLRLFSSTARAAGLVEVARGLHQLAVQNGRSRSSPDGVVAENHVLVIEYRARPRPPDHGGHAVFGVQVELRLWPVLLFTQYDGMLGRGRQLLHFRYRTVFPPGREQVGHGGFGPQRYRNGLCVPVLHHYPVAMSADGEVSCLDTPVVEASEHLP